MSSCNDAGTSGWSHIVGSWILSHFEHLPHIGRQVRVSGKAADVTYVDI